MKKIIFILTLGVCGLATAQTNAQLTRMDLQPTLHTNAPVAKVKAPAKAKPPTEIDSDTADFDLNIHQAIYRNHVVVVDPQMKLKCEQLVVYLPPSGERVNHIVAQTNVVIDFADQQGQMTHAVADLADYRYLVSNGVTNETVTLTGNPQVENSQGTLTGDPINWDRGNNRMTATNPHRKSKPAVEGSTNAPPLKLF